MRLELIHPMIVHFPIALLATGAVLKFVGFLVRKSRFYQMITILSLCMLTIGAALAWAAVIAGEVAEDIVRSHLCNIDILEDHRLLAYTTASIFSVAVVLDWGRAWLKRRRAYSGFRKAVTIIVSLLYIVGTAILLGVGWLGGNLVYDQGAAVKRECQE
jgi:uncharacterized membrane protein